MAENFDSPQFEKQLFKPKRAFFKRWWVWVVAVLVVVAGWSIYNFSLAYRTIVVRNGQDWVNGVADGHQDDSKNPLPKDDPNRLDILILGIRGEDDLQNGGLLSDSIEVLSVDQTTKKAAMISIPRDLYIDMLGVHGKINEAYAIGYEHKAGIPLTAQIVSRISGIHIDKTVVFNFQAFQDIVENLGGVDVHLDKPFSEPSQWGYPFSLPAGDNHLNGEQALYYVRSRYSSSDFDRARRQQQVMVAIEKKATSLGLLTNPLKINGLLTSLKNNIRTDFQIWDINSLLNLAPIFSSPSSIKHYIISTDNLLDQGKNNKGEYILTPKTGDYGKIKELFQTILD